MKVIKLFNDEIKLFGKSYPIIGVKADNENKLMLPERLAKKVLMEKLLLVFTGKKLDTNSIMFVSDDRFGELMAHHEIELYSWMRL